MKNYTQALRTAVLGVSTSEQKLEPCRICKSHRRGQLGRAGRDMWLEHKESTKYGRTARWQPSPYTTMAAELAAGPPQKSSICSFTADAAKHPKRLQTESSYRAFDDSKALVQRMSLGDLKGMGPKTVTVRGFYFLDKVIS